MEAYKLIIAFQAMEEFAQQSNARRANAALASRGAAEVGRAASAQRREPSRLARLGTVLGNATTWLQGRVLVLRGARRVSPAPALRPD